MWIFQGVGGLAAKRVEPNASIWGHRQLTIKLPPALASLAPVSTAQERRAGNFWTLRGIGGATLVVSGEWDWTERV